METMDHARQSAEAWRKRYEKQTQMVVNMCKDLARLRECDRDHMATQAKLDAAEQAFKDLQRLNEQVQKDFAFACCENGRLRAECKRLCGENAVLRAWASRHGQSAE